MQSVERRLVVRNGFVELLISKTLQLIGKLKERLFHKHNAKLSLVLLVDKENLFLDSYVGFVSTHREYQRNKMRHLIEIIFIATIFIATTIVYCCA